MRAPLAKMPELWGDAGFAMEVELTDVIANWLGSVNDRMIQGWASLVAQMVRHLPAMQETWV